MSPTGSKTGNLNSSLNAILWNWNQKHQRSAARMNEWIANGCRLAWLIAPGRQQVYIYKPQQKKPMVQSFSEKLKGDRVLPGFEIDLHQISG